MAKNAPPASEEVFNTLLSIERKLYQVTQSFLKIGNPNAAALVRPLLREVSNAIEQYAGS